jgi:hypothetical protein
VSIQSIFKAFYESQKIFSQVWNKTGENSMFCKICHATDIHRSHTAMKTNTLKLQSHKNAVRCYSYTHHINSQYTDSEAANGT